MGKLTDPKWWIGQSPEQKARRAKAVQDYRATRQDMRETAAEFGEARERGSQNRAAKRAARRQARDDG